MFALRYAARSDVGLIRRGNEDSGYASPHLLIVADGMGGHAAGELASATVIATLAGLDRNDVDELTLVGAVDEAGQQITTVVAGTPELAGMGTTVTALVWQQPNMAVVHVGDSRAYLLRDGALTQLTVDHTYVQTLVDAGRITLEEAAVHPRRSLLMRAIDGSEGVPVDHNVAEAMPGDRYLVCSDGLTTVVTDDDIRFIVGDREPTAAVTALVELALSRGAPDNVTVVVAHVIDADELTAARMASQPPVVVGAAGEPRVRAQLPQVRFPDDAQPDPNRPDLPPPAVGAPTSEQPALRTPNGWMPRALPLTLRQLRARRIIRNTIISVGVTVLALAAVVGIGRLWWQNQWYVGVSDSQVTIFQGIEGSFLGVPLHRTEDVTTISVSNLPTFNAELVGKGIPASDIADAQRIVNELDTLAQACVSSKPPAGCPQAPL
jgi:protein phosphatase